MSEPADGYSPPEVGVSDDVRVVTNSGAAERLVFYDQLPPRGVTLLFLRGRSATPTPDGGSAWADMEGGRVIVFDKDGVVGSVLGGRPDEGPALAQPAFVALDDGSVLAVEGDGSALRFSGPEAQRWIGSSTPGSLVGGGDRPLAAFRTLFDIQLVPLSPEEPLLWVGDRPGALSPVGSIDMPGQAMLAPVVNSGWAAPLADGSVAFASAVRPELRLFGADGELRWKASWPHAGVSEPGFAISEGTLVPRFELIGQALVEGPDHNLYALAAIEGAEPGSTPDPSGSADSRRRLLVFDGDGVLVREGIVDGEAAIYVGARGHVYVADATDAHSRTEAVASLPPFEPFDLPDLLGSENVRLEEHHGKVVIVNFWASWCSPCRQEMPLLDELARRLDPDRAVVIGLNEDVTPSDAIDFLDGLGGVSYAVAEGRGRLRDEYGYRGLPYTVVLDGDGRMVKAFYGFGSSIAPIEAAVSAALDEAYRGQGGSR